MMAIKKLIFDNDGVNIDSEDVAMQVMDDEGYTLVTRYKPDADLKRGDIYREYPGTSTDKIVEALIEKFDLPEDQIREDYNIDADIPISIELADQITLETNRRFETDLKAIPGVTETHQKLRKKYGQNNIALATTSREDRMDTSLAVAVDPATGENAGLEDFFPKGPLRMSGYDHANKYDKFFELTGWDPEECAITEDSISGATKAKAGRPNVIVIGTVAAKFYENKADQAAKLIEAGASIVISDMRDVPAALRWIDNGLDADQIPAFNKAFFVVETEALQATASLPTGGVIMKPAPKRA